MNKIRKILQCIKFRRCVLGKVGKGNKFRPNVIVTSAAVIGNHNYFWRSHYDWKCKNR